MAKRNRLKRSNDVEGTRRPARVTPPAPDVSASRAATPKARTRSTAKRIAELKREFDAAHRLGMDALKRRDYPSLTDAITREKAVIDEQGRALEGRRKAKRR